MWRSTRVNTMEDLDGFLARWETPEHPDNGRAHVLKTTPQGNINSTGEAGNYYGPAVSMHQLDFEASIEPGVRSLVLAMVQRHGLLTYTSCEGHEYPGTSIPPVERHVGVLACTDHQLNAVRRLFESTTNVVPRLGPVRVEVFVHALYGARRAVPAVDLFFRRRRPWPYRAYFSALEAATARVLDRLRREPATRG